MISIFGIISIAIAVLSVVAIVLHNRVMGKRTPVDTLSAELESLLRDRVEMLHQYSRPGSELRELCDMCIDLDLESMLKALPEIGRAFDDEREAGNLIISEPLEEYPEAAMDNYVSMAKLDNNTQAIQEATLSLNQAIDAYNDFITNRFPAVFMAQILGLNTEEPYHVLK